MFFMKRSIAWPVWKIGVLKFSMATCGILAGAYFPEFWLPWERLLWGIFGVTAVLTTIWGVQAMFGASSNEHSAV